MNGETEHRQIIYRVHPGSRERARKLASVAGACRFVWNEILDQQDQLYTIARMCGSKPLSPSFFTLGKAFTQLRRMTPWLQEMPYAAVRYTLKHQADAWQRYFTGQGGRPKFKKRGSDSVTLPQDVRIEGDRLHFPKIGWMRLSRRGRNPYPEGRAVSATIKRVCGKWYATVCYAVDVFERPDDGVVSLFSSIEAQVFSSH